MEYFDESLWDGPLFESHSRSEFPHVLLKSESRNALFRLIPVRLVPVQYLPGLGLELLDLLELLDPDLPRALALVFDRGDRPPDSPGRSAAAATAASGIVHICARSCCCCHCHISSRILDLDLSLHLDLY